MGPLSNHAFRRLWLAQAVSRLGDSIHELALVFLVYEVTNDPGLVAVTVVASLVPSALASVPAGALADRYNRKWLLAGAEVVRGAVVLCIPLFGRGARLVPVVVGVAFVAGLMQAVASPARSALIPNLVDEDDLDAANGLSRTTESIGRLLYVVGGAIVAVIGPFTAFYLDAGSFVLSAGILATLPTAVCQPDAPTSTGMATLTDRIRGSFARLRGNPLLRSLVLLSGATAFALGPIGIVLPFYAESSLGFQDVSATAFGGLYTAVYVGLLLGSLGVGGASQRFDPDRGTIIVAGLLLLTVGLTATAHLPTVVAWPVAGAVGSLLVVGTAVGTVQVPVSSLAQEAVPDDERGKLFSFMRIPALLAPPVSVALAGVVMEQFGAAAVLVCEAVLVVLLAGVLLDSPLAGEARELLSWWVVATGIGVLLVGALQFGIDTVLLGPVAVVPTAVLVPGWVGATAGAVGRTLTDRWRTLTGVRAVAAATLVAGVLLLGAGVVLPISFSPSAVTVAVLLGIVLGFAALQITGRTST